MKTSRFGLLAAGAALGLAGAVVAAPAAHAEDEKACYRPHCGTSVKGHAGKCGGTRVEGLSDPAACESAGGVWTTEADAAQYKDKKS